MKLYMYDWIYEKGVLTPFCNLEGLKITPGNRVETKTDPFQFFYNICLIWRLCLWQDKKNQKSISKIQHIYTCNNETLLTLGHKNLAVLMGGHIKWGSLSKKMTD